MQPDEMLTEIRANLAGLTPEQAQYLLARYDEAIVNVNEKADGLQKMASQCREARHVADLVIAVLKMAQHRWNSEGILAFLNVIAGKYPWLIK